MTIIRPHAMPPFWWLVPWSYARTLYRAANALRALSDKQDDTIALQHHVMASQEEEIEWLRHRIVELEDAITAGKDIIPDAKPHE